MAAVCGSQVIWNEGFGRQADQSAAFVAEHLVQSAVDQDEPR